MEYRRSKILAALYEKIGELVETRPALPFMLVPMTLFKGESRALWPTSDEPNFISALAKVTGIAAETIDSMDPEDDEPVRVAVPNFRGFYVYAELDQKEATRVFSFGRPGPDNDGGVREISQERELVSSGSGGSGLFGWR